MATDKGKKSKKGMQYQYFFVKTSFLKVKIIKKVKIEIFYLKKKLEFSYFSDCVSPWSVATTCKKNIFKVDNYFSFTLS